jgi:hypothetical protein
MQIPVDYSTIHVKGVYMSSHPCVSTVSRLKTWIQKIGVINMQSSKRGANMQLEVKTKALIQLDLYYVFTCLPFRHVV